MANILRRTTTAVLAALLFAPIYLAVRKQEARASMAASEYTQESVVVELDLTKAVFENDGTSTNENIARIRIQSQAGVQAFGILHIAYPSSNATVEVLYVRVTKPDGRVVVTPAGNVMDLPAAVTQSAPLHSDLHEKQVPVKGLEIGDSLEFDIVVHLQTPLVPGQFWFSYEFNHSSIILSEELDVSVPRDRAVIVASKVLQPTISVDQNRKKYVWKSANLDRKASDAAASSRSSIHIPPPDVQMTTFRSWDEIADWYGKLAAEPSQPTAEIRAQAEKLTKGAASENEKVRILYNFVATKIRYVGLDFGIGRYMPHAAADVMDNGYGDCKDKHTLLAALLSAIGVKSYPALVNSSKDIDPETPSPAQFDHVVTVVPEGTSTIWLDTTSEVSPFGLLTSNLRDHNSLIVTEQRPTKLVKAPNDTPVPTFMDFNITGKLDTAGTLEAKIDVDFRGDFEVPYRQLFRNIPESRWKDGVQGMSAGWGFAGAVSDPVVSPPEATDKPFHISYTYIRKDFGDWPNRRIMAAFPQPLLTRIRDDKEFQNQPVELGPRGEFTMHGSIELPDGFSPLIPAPAKVSINEDFAKYETSYSFAGSTFKYDRHVVTATQEIPAGKRGEYLKFQKSVSDDEDRMIQIIDNKLAQNQLAKNPEAAKLYQQSLEAFQQRDVQTALDLSRRAIAADPEYPDPYKIFVSSLMVTGREEEAIDPLRKLEKLTPKDPIAAAEIGRILLSRKRPREALQDLEPAAKNFPENPKIAMELGQAYIRSGSNDKAIPFLKRAAELDSSPTNLNNVAWELADANIGLEDALKFAETATLQLEEQSSKTNAEKMDTQDWLFPQRLRSFWDTLGWVHFRLSHFEQAEKYLRAAWQLDSSGTVGDHLGQAYEKDGKRQEAIHVYSLAAGSDNPGMDHALVRVQKLVGNDLKGDDIVLAAREEYRSINRVRIPRVSRGGSSAEFLVTFKSGSTDHEVRFSRGSEELRGATAQIRNAKFDIRFPDDRPATMVLSGHLSCAPTGATCEFLLIKPLVSRAPN